MMLVVEKQEAEKESSERTDSKRFRNDWICVGCRLAATTSYSSLYFSCRYYSMADSKLNMNCYIVIFLYVAHFMKSCHNEISGVFRWREGAKGSHEMDQGRKEALCRECFKILDCEESINIFALSEYIKKSAFLKIDLLSVLAKYLPKLRIGGE